MEMMSTQRTSTFPSMSESTDLGKEKNFFETPAPEFRSTGASQAIDPQTRQTGA
jgi:hypothetical protein